MKSSTRNIELPYDIDGDNCGMEECKALRADVDVRGGKVRSVDLRCEVADEVDTVDKKREEGMPIDQICRRIRARMIKARYPFDDKTLQKYACGTLKDAAKFLAKQEKAAEKSRKR